MSLQVEIEKKLNDKVLSVSFDTEGKQGITGILGASGCGKSMTLKCIAGIETPDRGKIVLNGRVLFDSGKKINLRVQDRHVGYLFQNYALFPNMTVEKNIAAGFQYRPGQKMSAEEIKKQTADYMELLHVTELKSSYPGKLSGGQQQRVALARALVIKPDVLLMDEPLSNLDAKLRVEMRTVIKEIQHTVGITNVYVTHDQEEAMAVSDRIAVMNQGDIQQVGTPKAIYQRPANLFVATFIGRSNILPGTLKVQGGKCVLCFDAGFEVELHNVLPEQQKQQRVQISVRPEEFVLSTSQEAGGLKATVDSSVFLGLNTHYFAHTDEGERIEIIQESQIDSVIPDGAVIRLGVKTEKINVFGEDGAHNLLEGVHDDNAV